MKISRDWLQTYFADSLPSAEELGDALTFHAFELDGIEEMGGDRVLDIAITPNRGHDCLCHRGIAREVAAITGLPMKDDPLRRDAVLQPTTDTVRVSIEEGSSCSRYTAGYIRGVKVGPSPEWLRVRLEALGQRSINNVVDATNYVMFGLGQPLHAFDAAQLARNDETSSRQYEISVRRARVGETLLALDGEEYELDDSMTVIADAHTDAAIGIAGVKGGKPAGVSEATTDIIIESANFDGPATRKTAAKLKLRTDASARFEQVISPMLARHGMRAVVDLILDLAGGELVGFAEAGAESAAQPAVPVTGAQVNALLGVEFSLEQMAQALNRLGLPFSQDGDVFTVTPPFERLDLCIAEDLIEEIGRIIGYDKVPTEMLPPATAEPAVNSRFYYTEKVREFLMQEGFSEVFTSVFTHEGKRAVLNKVDSDRPFLRECIAPGLVTALARNIYNAPLLGASDIRIFEIGVTWSAESEHTHLAIGISGGKKSPKPEEVLARLAEHLGATVPNVSANDGVVEVDFNALIDGLEAPDHYDTLPLPEATRYHSFSAYPFVLRDIAAWTPEGTTAEDFGALVVGQAGELLVRADLFDQFSKDGRTSYAFHLVFQSPEKTLTEGEVNEVMGRVEAACKSAGYEVR